MTLPERLKFGIFMGPFHVLGDNPTLALERDLETIQWLDYLDFDEAWDWTRSYTFCFKKWIGYF